MEKALNDGTIKELYATTWKPSHNELLDKWEILLHRYHQIERNYLLMRTRQSVRHRKDQ